MSTTRDHIARLLDSLGLSTSDDQELAATPERFAELLRERFVPVDLTGMSTFPAGEGERGPVVVRNIQFHALCAHHIVPFFGRVHIAYLPDEHLAGFGSFTRLVDEAARGPQLQERMVARIADELQRSLAPRAVLVACEARQMCMELTGSPAHSQTITYASRGLWKVEDAARHASELFGASRHG